MKEIQLTQGFVAIVDDDDYRELSKHKWHTEIHERTQYAVRNIETKSGRTKIYMHRIILNVNSGMQVDHIDRNGLNNLRCNLRVATASQNRANVAPTKRNTSGYKGVHKSSERNKWKATIYVNYNMISLGVFDNPIDAAIAYNVAAIKYHGEFAYQNQVGEQNA